MARYIDANEFKRKIEQYLPEDRELALKVLKKVPTADVVPKEDIINDLTNEISERIIQALEANYEIIPKKPVVRCKDCKHLIRSEGVCGLLSNNYEPPVYVDDDDFCSRGIDAGKEEVNIYEMIAHLEELGVHKEKRKGERKMPKYIQENELKEWIQNWFETNRYYHPYSRSNDIPIPELYDILERMPTADVPDRKVGKWIDPAADDVYRCSVCEEYTKLEVPRLFYHYCPKCGAVMDERSEEE